MLDIPEQMHELWFDYGRGYSLHQFVEEMAGKIIWGLASSFKLGEWMKIVGLSGRSTQMLSLLV